MNILEMHMDLCRRLYRGDSTEVRISTDDGVHWVAGIDPDHDGRFQIESLRCYSPLDALLNLRRILTACDGRPEDFRPEPEERRIIFAGTISAPKLEIHAPGL